MKVITAARIPRRNLRHSRILEGDKQTDGSETRLFTEETIRSVKLSSVGFFTATRNVSTACTSV